MNRGDAYGVVVPLVAVGPISDNVRDETPCNSQSPCGCRMPNGGGTTALKRLR